MSPLYRWTLKLARFVHLYLTLLGLGLLLFFAVTGVLLNHEQWFFPGDPEMREINGKVPTEMLTEPDRFTISEWLRREQGAAGLVDSFEIDPARLRVVFKRPGQEMVFEIECADGELRGDVQSHGLMGAFLDLHRGKSCGLVWVVLIDVVAGLMLVISATGLVLWWALKGRGHYGFATLLLGIFGAIALYLAFVP